MSDQKRDREQWELVIITVLLMYRPILFFGALLLLGYTILVIFANPSIGVVAAGLTLLLFLVVFSYRAALLLARLGAWIATRRP